MGSMPWALISAWSLATSRRARRAPWIFGCSVLTRPASISFTPVTSATARTAIPSFARSSAVPPVERISIPSDARPRPSSTMPVLSETERRARETDMRALLPCALAARTRRRARARLLRSAVARLGAAVAGRARIGRARLRLRLRGGRAVVRGGERVPMLLAALFTLALRGASPRDALLLVLTHGVRAALLLRGSLAVRRRGRVADGGVRALPRERRVRALRGRRVRALCRDRRIGALRRDRRVGALRRARAVGARHRRRIRRARGRLLIFLRALRVARRRVLLRIAEIHLRECRGGAERKRREDRDSHASSCRGRLPSLRGPSRRANLSTWSWPGPACLHRDRSRARKGAGSEAERDELADQVRVQRDRVEAARPADLRPVIGLDLAQHGAPPLRRYGYEAVVPSCLLREVGVRGPEERIGVEQIAVRGDAAVRDAFDVRHFDVEPLERRDRQIGQGTNRRRGDSLEREIGERRPEVRRTDGDEGRDTPFEPEAGDGVAGIEAAHAVGDDVHPLARQASHELSELLGPGGDGTRRRHPWVVELRSKGTEPLGDVAEVAMPAARYRDLVEPEHAVGEHHGMPQAGRAAGRQRPARKATPPCDEERRKKRNDSKKKQRRVRPDHGTILPARGGFARWVSLGPSHTSAAWTLIVVVVEDLPGAARRRGWVARLVVGDAPPAGEAPRLELSHPLASEVHDGADLLERDPAAIRHVESTGVADLPQLLVGKVHLHRPGPRVHVDVQVELARHVRTGTRPLRAVGAQLGPRRLQLGRERLQLRIDPARSHLLAELPRHLLAAHRARPLPLLGGGRIGTVEIAFRVVHRSPLPVSSRAVI